ncbi:MAG TPA: YndM family protein [Bacillales bacterium]|nr:YndM family protein [Bacillales bacterium]
MVLLIKFITSLVAYAVAFDLFFDATWVDIISFSLLTTIVSYSLGDRILLPRIGNINAIIADFLLSYSIVWVFGSVLLNSLLQIAWGSIISAIIISASEYFVHRRILNAMPEEDRNRGGAPGKFAYAMEMGEESEPLKEK